MSAQKLGAVGLMLLGVWWILSAIENAAQYWQIILRASESGTWQLALSSASLVLPVLIGICLVWWSPGLARRCLPADGIQQGPTGTELLPAAIAALAAYLILDRLSYVVRLVLPFLSTPEDRQDGMLMPWVELGSIGAAALAFLYSHKIARWWGRRSERGERA